MSHSFLNTLNYSQWNSWKQSAEYTTYVYLIVMVSWKSFLRLSRFFEPSPTIKKLLKPRWWGMIFYLLYSMYHTCKSHKEAISCNGFPFNRKLARHQVLQNEQKKPNLFLFRVGCTNFFRLERRRKHLVQEEGTLSQYNLERVSFNENAFQQNQFRSGALFFVQAKNSYVLEIDNCCHKRAI